MQQQINRRMSELTAIASARMPGHWEPNTSCASVDHLTDSEKSEMHELRMQLPTFGDLAEQAKMRLIEKRQRRL